MRGAFYNAKVAMERKARAEFFMVIEVLRGTASRADAATAQCISASFQGVIE